MVETGWVDVTAALRRGVQSLRTGELLARTDFSPDQAISAIEIGDSRMDQPLTEACHIPSLLAAGRMPTNLSMAQVAALMDAMTFSLVQWWKGHSLQQTLQTVLYFRAQEELKDFPLLAASTGLVTALVSVSRDVISLSGVLMVCPCSFPHA
jgi:Mak10 subunit, NatC N(alpha)-terminal acetyltransferase